MFLRSSNNKKFPTSQEPFGGFEQCVGGHFSATLSEFQYQSLLTNFLILWVLLLGHLSLLV